MMHAIEFIATMKNGMIPVPKKYLAKPVKSGIEMRGRGDSLVALTSGREPVAETIPNDG